MHVNGLDLEKNDLVSSQSATRRTEQAEGGRGGRRRGRGERRGKCRRCGVNQPTLSRLIFDREQRQQSFISDTFP